MTGAPSIYENTRTESPPIPFEGPPTTSDDFDWDEQDISKDSEWLAMEDNVDFVDGMASLSVDEQDTGYLGVASGGGSSAYSTTR
jgi:transcriptional regulatory protein GAL4